MAGSPGGTTIGRVNIKVLPDTSEFRRRLQAQLKNLNTVRIKVEITRKSLQDVKKKLEKWRDDISPLKVMVRPELFSPAMAAASARLAYLTRPRRVPIIAILSQTSVGKVAAGIATLVAAMSGARVVSTMFDKIWNSVKRLDKAVPAIAGIGTSVLGLSGAVLSSVSNITALGVSLASISAILLTMPGQLAGMAIGIGITIAALKDFNKVLPEVGQWFKRLQDMISANFWAKAAEPIRGFFNTLKGEAEAGVGSAATALGDFFGTYSTALAGALGNGVLTQMFADLTSSINIAKQAAEPFANIIRILGQLGAAWLPALAGWFLDISNQFSNWLSVNDANGNLMSWVETGIENLKALGSGLRDLIATFGIIGQVAQENGGSTLAMWAQTMADMRAAVSESGFQEALGAAFRGSHEMMSRIAGIGGEAFKQMAADVGNTFATLLPQVGTNLGIALSGVSTALSSLVNSGGLSDFMSGLTVALQGLAPAMAPIGTMLGALGTSLGVFMTTLGPTLGSLLSGLATTISGLLPVINPILEILGGVFAQVVAEVMSLVQQLAPIIGQVLVQMAPVLAQVGAALGQILPLIGSLIGAVLPLIGAILTPIMAILSALIPIILNIAMAILPPVIAAVTQLVAALQPFLAVIGEIVVWVLEKLSPVFTFLAEMIASVLTGIIGGITGFVDGFMMVFEGFKTMFSGGWSGFWEGIKMIVSGIWEMIKGAFMVFLNVGVLGVARKGLTVLGSVFTGAWTAIKAGVTGFVNIVKLLFSAFIQTIRGNVKGGLDFIKNVFVGTFNGVRAAVTAGWSLIKSQFSGGVSAVMGFVTGLPGRIKGVFSGALNLLKDVGAKIIQGLINGISGMFGKVKDKLGELTGKLTSWKGPESLDRVILYDAGRLIIGGLVRGMESQYDTVRRSLQGLTHDIAGTEFGAPTVGAFTGARAAFASASVDTPQAGLVGGDLNLTIPVSNTSATPEEIADSILFAVRRLQAGGAYR